MSVFLFAPRARADWADASALRRFGAALMASAVLAGCGASPPARPPDGPADQRLVLRCDDAEPALLAVHGGPTGRRATLSRTGQHVALERTADATTWADVAGQHRVRMQGPQTTIEIARMRPVVCTVDTGPGTLERALAPLAAAHPGLSGIHPLARGQDAFAARAALAEAAERTIDAQYYIWHLDTSGRLLLQSLRRAADRGVHVRLLLDDNNTGALDSTLMALAAHPHIEVRVFNPMLHRGLRWLNYVVDFARANRRMHNKSFTVDRQATVVGGRNVGNEYFGAGDGVMFADLDVLAVGTVVAAVADDFQRYWDNASSYPITSVLPSGAQTSDPGTTPASDAPTRAYLEAIERSGFLGQLRGGQLPLQWALAQMVSDDPAKGLGLARGDQTLPARMADVMGAAERNLTIVSPYFVPTDAGTAMLTRLARRGVAVTVLTNALAATDVAAVHAGYAKHRVALLHGGVRLQELKRDATVVAQGQHGLMGSSGASLHAKTFSMDGRRIFVGSFNFDPRSAELNTEMGLVIESTALAGQLEAALQRPPGPYTYTVTLDGGALRWTTLEGDRLVVFDNEPGTSWLKRAGVRVLSWLPIEGLL